MAARKTTLATNLVGRYVRVPKATLARIAEIGCTVNEFMLRQWPVADNAVVEIVAVWREPESTQFPVWVQLVAKDGTTWDAPVGAYDVFTAQQLADVLNAERCDPAQPTVTVEQIVG